jgi:hypothetical protein
MNPPGAFVISLDLELFWGMHDLFDDAAQYAPNLEGAWEAVPRMLQIFDEAGINATWATVGFLFARDPAEMAALKPAVLPEYGNPRRSPYPLFDRLVASGEMDRYHYGWPLVEQVAEVPGQEIATHTLSHYWALEPGATVEAFASEMDIAVTVARQRGIEMTSIVFPRNYIETGHIAALARYGIKAFRGNQPLFMHGPSHPQPQRTMARAMKLADTYVPLTRYAGQPRPLQTLHGAVDVPATRFLRPFTPGRRHLEPLRLRRTRSEMITAAQRGLIYHLWWHPHNFGHYVEENFAMLESIVATFRRLRDEHGFASLTMAEAAVEFGPGTMSGR